jgi:hypothetical protein
MTDGVGRHWKVELHTVISTPRFGGFPWKPIRVSSGVGADLRSGAFCIAVARDLL